MNEENQNFDELKRLLKLKRHELPPPGYYNNFSNGVIAGIRREQRPGGSVIRLNSEAPWLVRFLRVFEARPGLIGGFATSLVLILVFGVVLSDRSNSDTQNVFAMPTADANSSTVASVDPTASATPQNYAANTMDSSGGISVSTNPATSLQPSAAPFGQPNSSQLFLPAGFSPAGN